MKIVEKHIDWKSLRLGEDYAWRQLYEQHYAVSCKIAYDFIEDPDQAETIVEDAILHLWEIRESVELRGSLRAYLIQAVKNRCLNYLQATQDRREVCFSKLPLETLHSDAFFRESDRHPLGILLIKELEEEVRKAVKALPPDTLRVFSKSRFGYKKNEDIARELGISINTVKYHLKKALSLLREQLGKYTQILVALLFLPEGVL